MPLRILIYFVIAVLVSTGLRYVQLAYSFSLSSSWKILLTLLLILFGTTVSDKILKRKQLLDKKIGIPFVLVIFIVSMGVIFVSYQ